MPGEGRSIGPVMVIFAVLLPVAVAVWLMVRSLYRWAGGVERKDGTRIHPGLGMPLLMVILLTIGGPLLLAGIAGMILPAGERRDPHAESRRFMEEEEARVNARNAVSSVTDSIDWYHDLPEVKIPLSLNPGLKVEFRLVRSLIHATDENRLQTTDLGEISYDVERGPRGVQGLAPYKTHLFIGTTAPRKDGAGLTAVCQWEQNRKVNIDMDFRDWQFEMKLPDELVFSEEGVSEYVIATKGKENPETAEQLVLRAVVTEAYD